jgi:hypothetical protein
MTRNQYFSEYGGFTRNNNAMDLPEEKTRLTTQEQVLSSIAPIDHTTSKTSHVTLTSKQFRKTPDAVLHQKKDVGFMSSTKTGDEDTARGSQKAGKRPASACREIPRANMF